MDKMMYIDFKLDLCFQGQYERSRLKARMQFLCTNLCVRAVTSLCIDEIQ